MENKQDFLKVDEGLVKDLTAGLKEIGKDSENFKAKAAEVDEMKGKMEEQAKELATIKANMKERFANKEQKTNFLKFIHDTIVKDTTGTTTIANAVPTDIIPIVEKIQEQYGFVRRECRVIPTNAANLTVLRKTADPTVYWVNSGVSLTMSRPALAGSDFSVKKLAGYMGIPNEEFDDPVMDIANFYLESFGMAIAKEEDRVGLIGDTTASPADQFNGIMNTATYVKNVAMGSTEDAFADITYDHLSEMIAYIPEGEKANAKFAVNAELIHYLRILKDSQNRPIWADGIGAQPSTIFGYPVVTTATLPNIAASAASTPFLIFGNFQNLRMWQKKGLEVARSTEVLFGDDATAIRMLERIAFDVRPVAYSFVKLTTSAT